MTLDSVKWAATITLIVSVGLNGLGLYPHGPIVQVLGGTLWLIASLKMKDKPLIVTNGLMTLVGILALGYSYYEG